MGVRKMVRGYMTVEASFLITWTIILFVFMIYLAFYSYDKCVLFQDSYGICFRGSIQKDEKQIVPYINQHIKEQYGKKYFGVGEVKGSVSAGGKTVSVIGECSVKVPVHSVFTKDGEEGWNIRTQAKAQIVNPTRVIRTCRVVKRMVTQ